MVPMLARERRLQRVLEPLRSQFEFIFIDCPPSLGLLTLNALVAADAVLIPLHCEYFALEGLADLVGTMRRVRGVLNPSLDIEGVLLTMYDDRTNLGSSLRATSVISSRTRCSTRSFRATFVWRSAESRDAGRLVRHQIARRRRLHRARERNAFTPRDRAA
jgi:cellulose biosynthesis protein BcsQ